MKKLKRILMVTIIVAIIGFVPLKAWSECDVAYGELDIDHFFDYTKKFESYDAGVCASNSTKTYMDYRAVTLESSIQIIGKTSLFSTWLVLMLV